MNILYVINSFSWGGAEKLVFDLSQEMVRYADWVGVVALYNNGDDIEASMRHQLTTKGVTTFIVDKKAGKDRIKSILKIAKIIKNNNVDLIHGHCSVPMLLSKMAGKLEHRKVVCTIHNTQGYSKKREKYTQWLVDAYISIGEAAETYMINQLGISQKRIHRIYNAIDVKKFSGASRRDGFWRQYCGKDGEISLLNVARVSEQKNQICLLRAVRLCVEKGLNVKCYILGAYDEKNETYQNLIKYAIENQIENNICFLGMHNNVEDFLANADCFILSSLYEGLSVAFLEAVVSGVPIVCSDMPFVNELNAISNCSTVFEQDNDKQLAQIIFNNEYKPQSSETVKKFSDLFSMKRFVDQHRKLYLKCIR